MVVVAIGHWLGMVVVLDHGELDGGNLLDFSPEYGWITWIGQVMPLFFFVGGFASATSLRSAERKGVRPADWIATRLHRMVTPAAALAGFWAVALVLGAAVGGFGVVALGGRPPPPSRCGSSPTTRSTPPSPRSPSAGSGRDPGGWWRASLVLFALAEAARFAGIPVVPQVNWVIGWLGFQVAGFAWQDGRLPDGTSPHRAGRHLLGAGRRRRRPRARGRR